MADNTRQFDYIVMIQGGLAALFADRPDVFVAGDLLWYPVSDRAISGPVAPDVMVAFGRPKGRRGAYRQWEEGGIAPQVVFEVLSPSNSQMEMADKLRFYDQYGVEEYYLYDPKHHHLEIYQRPHRRLKRVRHLNGWTSPRLGIRLVLTPVTLEIYHPNGQPFLSSVELARLKDAAQDQAEQEAARAEQADARAAREAARAERLAERLRALGIDPDDVSGIRD